MNIALEDAEVGAQVAERNFDPVGREQLQAYAQASGDLNPLHLDPAFARKAGFDDVIVHGMLGMALLGRLLEEDLGHYRLLAFSTRFTGVVKVGQTLRCRALLSGRAEGTATLSLEAIDGEGRAVINGSAQVALDRP